MHPPRKRESLAQVQVVAPELIMTEVQFVALMFQLKLITILLAFMLGSGLGVIIGTMLTRNR
jgi:hypothetical protein